MKKSVPKIVIWKIVGFLIFLILLGVANYFTRYIPGNFYYSIVQFFNGNLGLIVVMMLFGMLSEVFWNLFFPLDLVAPIISAISSIFSVTFVYRIWLLVDSYVGTGVEIPMGGVYRLVFWLVLIIGYIVVLARIRRGEEGSVENWHEDRLKSKKEKLERKVEKIDKKLRKKEIEWSEVGDEFRKVLFNIGRGVSNLFDKKKNKKK